MAKRAVDGTKKNTVGEEVIVSDLTKNGLKDTAANLVIVRTALVRDPLSIDFLVIASGHRVPPVL